MFPGLRNTFEHALMWQTESWSLCSRLCGGGEQRRRVSCAMRLTERNITQKVPTSFCRTAGLRRPARVQECGMEGCPAWRKSPWSPCSRAECLSRDTGLRTRTIRCIKGHALVADDLCDSTVRPSSSQPCHNPECSGIWVLGEWSQVKRFFLTFLSSQLSLSSAPPPVAGAPSTAPCPASGSGAAWPPPQNAAKNRGLQNP